MMESMLISIGVIVAMAVVGVCAFFLCTRKFKCCERKNQSNGPRIPGEVGNESSPDVAVISDDQGHVFVVSGLSEGVPSQLQWKPPSYDDIVELPSYDEAILNSRPMGAIKKQDKSKRRNSSSGSQNMGNSQLENSNTRTVSQEYSAPSGSGDLGYPTGFVNPGFESDRTSPSSTMTSSNENQSASGVASLRDSGSITSDCTSAKDEND